MFRVVGVFLLCTASVRPAEFILEPMKPVNLFERYNYTAALNNYHLTKLTAELFRDAVMKMKIVKSTGATYEKSGMFEIGSITSNTYAMYEKMIAIYQDVSNLGKIKVMKWSEKNSIGRSLRAFGVCQGIYHKIRLEKKLFQELMQIKAKDFYEKKKDLEDELDKLDNPMLYSVDTNMLSKFAPKLFKGGMFVDRRFNFDEDNFDSNFELPILSKRNKQRKNSNRETVKTIAKKPDEKVTRNPYAPPPLNARSGHKPHPATFGGPKIPVAAFVEQPSNPMVKKIIRQLNKDNPQLNPDLDDYHRGLQVQSRRMVSNRYPAQPPKFESKAYPQSRRMGHSNPIPQPKLDTNSHFTALSSSVKADSYPKALRSVKAVSYPTDVRSDRSDKYPKKPMFYSHTLKPRQGYQAANGKRFMTHDQRTTKKLLWSPKINTFDRTESIYF